MTSASEPVPRSKRLLWSVLLLVLAGAGALWGASGLTWVGQRYRTPFGTETVSGATGAVLRPELVPMALAALAAVAAVLATGGLLRRLVGVLIALAGALLAWRAYQQISGGWFTHAGGDVPPGSTPIGELSTQPAGPALMALGAVLLLIAGVLVVVRAGRMPAMGARYSAPGAAKEQQSQDPDRQWWNELDAGRDPTQEDDR
ncbi:Trp biosynthesis-associated membrane protein [Saccharopolyspora dendranthemae]|uniref:Putative membrane protein (TIGR02234 family) n=1 Tax=Saccharopolyspora dendranthemae TaxID=1181886 RepID=A0A561VAR2_9PSEU|nr:Trp biosynthesis-associated membrane protein [Saccharopolyspora dendranthemae]TWG08715.1 putative membrane protein (TIGR02234 family) [Saccharopolyspora dendranthemae]